MLEKIHEEELALMENLNYSISALETLFSSLDSLLKETESLAHIRTAQIPMLSFEYGLDFNNPKHSEKENFKLRETAGTIDCFGGRRFGKTHCRYVDVSHTFRW